MPETHAAANVATIIIVNRRAAAILDIALLLTPRTVIFMLFTSFQFQIKRLKSSKTVEPLYGIKCGRVTKVNHYSEQNNGNLIRNLKTTKENCEWLTLDFTTALLFSFSRL